jgi:hypothetical protein
MLKFFRKYNQMILVVVTGLLMIAFLGGSALTAVLAPSPTSQIVGKAYGSPITQGDMQIIGRRTDILRAMGYSWTTPWGLDFQLEPLRELDYQLLLLEAQAYGLSPDLERARALLRNIDAQILTSLRLSFKVAEEEVEMAVANHMLVLDCWSTALRSVQTSGLEVNQEVVERFEKLPAEIIALSAEALVDASADIPDAEVQALFEKHKSDVPGTGLDFGYLIPDRVRVQSMRINTSEIQLKREISVVQAERHWAENKESFYRPDYIEPDPASDEVPQSPFYETFDEARGDVFAALQKKERLIAAASLAELLRGQLAEVWYSQDIGEDGFVIAPQGVEATDLYEKALSTLLNNHPEFKDNVQIEVSEPIVRGNINFSEGVQSARDYVPRGAPARGFAARAFTVQGLIRGTADQPVEAATSLAKFQTAPLPLIDRNENLYLFRVIEVEEAHAPTSITEVRDQVVTDARLARAFATLGEHANNLRNTVGPDGLRAAWDAFKGNLPEGIGSAFDADPFQRSTGTTGVPAIWGGSAPIRSSALIEGAYEMASKGEGELGVIEAPEQGSFYIVKVGAIQHLTPDDFKTKSRQLRSSLSTIRQTQLKRAWFTSEEIRKRTQFEIPS